MLARLINPPISAFVAMPHAGNQAEASAAPDTAIVNIG
jgi:hypothetical protein